MRAIPNLFLQLPGLLTDGKEIVRVITMDVGNDDITVQVMDPVTKQEYKIILPVGKALNILGYFKDEIKEKITVKKDVVLKEKVIVNEDKGESND